MASTGGKTSLSTHHIIHQVPHVRQKDDWDCGIACAAMLLGYYSGSDVPIPARRKSSREIRPRIWTIDIATLFEKAGIFYEFCTKTAGVNAGHRKRKVYRKHIAEDEPRITRKFTNAKEDGWNIKEKSLSLNEILMNLHNNCPILILVDARRIFCKNCDSKVSCILKRTAEYSGHYIVLVGYDDVDKLILYRDPSKKQRLCSMSYRCFEAARSSKGCDGDLILTSWEDFDE